MSATSRWGHLNRLAGVSGFGIALLALLLLATTANAADLLSDYPGYEQGGKASNLLGNVYSGTDFAFHAFTADLEYAVYHNSAFGQSFDGEYVYAYQLFNHGQGDWDLDFFDETSQNSLYSLHGFTVALYGYPQIDAVGVVSGTGVAPTTWMFNGSPSDPINSMDAVFTAPEIDPGMNSAIFYFTSPVGPEKAHAALTGGGDVNIDDPARQPFTPVPEPAMGGLAIIGGIALLLGAARRRTFR
jgi:hypothetical protein